MTADGGLHWTTESSPTTQYLYSVYFSDANLGYAVGWHGTILKTSNAGSTWTAQTSHVTSPLLSVYFTAANTGYAVGGASSWYLILKTSDGGLTWATDSTGGTHVLRSVYFTSANIGYAGGDNGLVLKTSNAGTSWSTLTTNTTFSIHSIYFPTAGTGYAMCSAGYVLKTANAGVSWVTTSSGFNAILLSTYFTSLNVGYASGGSGLIIKTTTGGETCLNTANAGNDATICSGSSAMLSASGGVTYSWSPATGLSSTNIFNPSANPTSTTIYTVTVTQANSCTSIDTVTVSVKPTPTANAGNDQTICAGQPATLTAIGGSTYLWSNTYTTATINVSPGTTTTYTVTVTASNGCTAADNVIVNVTQLPNANAGNNQSLCTGQSATLTATGGGTYLWSTTSTNDTTIVTPTTTSTYTITVTNSGCTASADVLVTVNPYPNANAGNDQTICYGQSATLTATGGGTYLWSNTATTAVTSVSPITPVTYTVTVTLNGCPATAGVTVFVSPPPIPSVGNDTTVCIGSTLTLTASGGNTYSWNNGITNGVPFTVLSSNVFFVTVTDLNSCTAIDSVHITVYPTPVCYAGNNQAVCAGDSVVLSATGGLTYVWSNGVINNDAFAPTATTTYYVTSTDNNGCTATGSVVVTVNPLPPTPVISLNGNLLTSNAASGNQWYLNNTSISGATSQTYTFSFPRTLLCNCYCQWLSFRHFKYY